MGSEYTQEENLELLPCQYCNRHFFRASLEKHRVGCERDWIRKNCSNGPKKDASKPPPVISNIMGVKVKIGSMADMLALGAERRKRWRLRHEEFLHVVLRARAAKRAELGEEPVPIEPLSPDVTQAGLVLCEKCGRRFSEGVFEKHKDACKEVRNLQAIELTEEQKEAKARFLKRMAYSSPLCGRPTQQENTEEKEATTTEAVSELNPSLSCAAEMQKMQSLRKDLIPSLSNLPEKLQQPDAFNQLLQQLLSTGLPPSRDDALLQISNCNKTVMPNCELAYPPESDSGSASQSLCGRNNPRESSVGDNSPKYSSPSAVSSVSSLSTFSPPLDFASECSQKGSLEDAIEIKQKTQGTSKPSQCFSGLSSSVISAIEPKFLTDCDSSKAVLGCVRKHRTPNTDNFKVTTATNMTNVAAPASDGDSYGTAPKIRSNTEQNTHLTTWMAKNQRSRPHGQPKINNYVKNNCKSSTGADSGLPGNLSICCESMNNIPVSFNSNETKSSSVSERHHHCHRHHHQRHHQRHGHGVGPRLDDHQPQKSCQLGSYCETTSSLVTRRDSLASSSCKSVRPTEPCPPPQVEICLKEAQGVPQSPLSHSNPASSPVFYQFVKTMEAGDRDSSGRFQEEIEKPMLSASRCGSTSAASISFMSAVTSNSQYRSAKAADHFQQPTAASPANSLSLVYLDVEGAPSADASVRSDNMLKPSTYSSDACKPTSLPSYALGNMTSAILTQTLRSDQFRPSRDRPVIYNEQKHLNGMNEVPPPGGSPTKMATMVQNISISDSTESFAQQKFCSQCGERFFENAKFCGLCGTSRRFGCHPSLVATAVRPRVNLASGQAASSH